MRSFFHAAVILFLSLLCAWAFAAAPEKEQTIQIRLPDKLKAAAGRMTMLDFYSAYCGTCQMMEPHLQALEKETGDKVGWKRLDLGQAENEPYVNQFGIDGTPAYFLFDENGKLVYKMENMISSKILRAQVLRRTGQLQVHAFPPDIRGLSFTRQPAYTLVTFEDVSCKPCATANKYFDAMEFAEDNHLKVVHLNPKETSVKKFMKDLKLGVSPSYVLFDNQSRELLRMEGNDLDPHAFWQYYTMLDTAN